MKVADWHYPEAYRVKTALRLVEAGKSLIPVKQDKMPHFVILRELRGTSSWKEAVEQPFSFTEVERFFQLDPLVNVAFLPSHSDALVLDLDTKHCIPPDLLDFLPKTVTELSGNGGYHFIYQKPGREVGGRVFWKSKLVGDAKTDGYVVCHPSVSENGPYAFLPGRSPWEVEAASLSEQQLKELCLRTCPQSPKNIHVLSTCPKYMSLDTLLASGDFIQKVAALLGSPISTPEQKFTCPLHPDESEPSANFHLTREGTYLFRCWHINRSMRLGDLYRFYRTGNPKPLNKGASVMWLLRLAVDAGHVMPPDVSTRRFLDDAPESASIVYAGCKLLCQCHLLYDGEGVFPATTGFMSEWCDLDSNAVLVGKRWLVSRGVLGVHERGQPWKEGAKSKPTLYRLVTDDMRKGGGIYDSSAHSDEARQPRCGKDRRGLPQEKHSRLPAHTPRFAGNRF